MIKEFISVWKKRNPGHRETKEAPQGHSQWWIHDLNPRNLTGNKGRSWGVCESVRVLVTQSCLTLCNPLDYSPSDSSVHGILQARILEWVVIPFSRGSSWPWDRTWVSWTTRVAQFCCQTYLNIPITKVTVQRAFLQRKKILTRQIHHNSTL